MREYITQAEVDAKLGAGWSGDKDPEYVVLQANVWLNNKLRKDVPEPTPKQVTLAGMELCKAIVKGSIFGDVEREELKLEVGAEPGLFVKKEFVKGSRAVSAEESFLNALLADYLARGSLRVAFLGRT